MAFKINVNDGEEFEERLRNGDVQISEVIVDSILKNLKGKKRFIHALDINLEPYNKTYSITADRKDFSEVLNKHLPILEKHQKYEKCAEIVKAIKYLKK